MPKTFPRALAALALATLAPLGSASAGDNPPTLPEPNLSDTELRARYALPSSRFVTIAGEEIHYADQGKGPAILFIHGSYASLRQWDDWAAKLSREFRVVRIDTSPSGLSGPNPSGDYSVAHRIATIDGLMDKLGIDRFVIVGTSSGGLPAAAYAAARPARIRAAMFINIAAGKVKMDPAAFPDSVKAAVAADMAHPTWHSEEYWRQILLLNMEHKERVTPALVRQWTEINNRNQARPEIGRQAAAGYDFTRTPADLAAITAPTLLLWGDGDHETSLEDHGLAAFKALGSVDKTLMAVPGCGHMLPLDCPAEGLARALPFLRRVTAR